MLKLLHVQCMMSQAPSIVCCHGTMRRSSTGLWAHKWCSGLLC